MDEIDGMDFDERRTTSYVYDDIKVSEVEAS